MKYKMLALDIDGTVTNSEKQISQVTQRAIERIQQSGVKVVLASGRPTYGVTPVADSLHLSRYGGYILSFNGARITNCQTNETIYHQTIPQEFIPELYRLSKEQGVVLLTYRDHYVITEGGKDDPYVQIEARINRMEPINVKSFVSFVDYPITKCLMVGEPDHMAMVEQYVKKEVGERLSIYRSEPYFLEIMPRNIDKAYSLNKMLEKLGFTREELIACGDGFNDISMISFAGLGVAMANAQPEVKRVADYIARSNDEDGVAQVIEEFMAESLHPKLFV